MAEYIEVVTTPLYFNSIVEVVSSMILPTYGNLVEADNYFSRRLRSQVWKEATAEEKVASLTEATRMIERLNFFGNKSTTTQVLQFPRGGDSAIPADIRVATYEIAIRLLDGVDPELEVDNLGSNAQGFGGLRNTYDRSFVLEHIRAGIPSAAAWALLKPYLIDPNTIRLSRVS